MTRDRFNLDSLPAIAIRTAVVAPLPPPALFVPRPRPEAPYANAGR